MNRKIKLYHFVIDEKFFDEVINHFDNDGRFDNRCFMIVDTPNYSFKYIKNNSRIELIYNKKMLKDILQNEYDALFFFSLPEYKIFNYIPKDRIIIWWAWGYDIYGMDRFIDIPLYKQYTNKYIENRSKRLSARIKNALKKIPILLDIKHGSRSKAIKRIDYFQPVLRSEYCLMQKVKGFRAKEFYYPGSWIGLESMCQQPPIEGNDILVGNSASFTNNHFDVWDKIEPFVPTDSKAVFPINYGNSNYANAICEKIGGGNKKVQFLKEFLPAEEYFKIIDNCSYAVFGVLRQEAMGNILHCLIKGVKVFLYEDSIPYNYLKSIGCYVYSIEEIDSDSFIIPLTKEERIHNQKVIIAEAKVRELISVQAINEIQLHFVDK